MGNNLFKQTIYGQRSASGICGQTFRSQGRPKRYLGRIQKTGAATDSLNFSLTLDGYPSPHFFLYSDAAPQGKIEKTFTIENAFGDNFKPVFICNEDEKKSAFLYVESSDCTVTPTLDGTAGMTLGMSGAVPIKGIKPGENKLTVTYQADPATSPEMEIKFAVETPAWTKFITRQITDTSEKTGEFTFTAE